MRLPTQPGSSILLMVAGLPFELGNVRALTSQVWPLVLSIRHSLFYFLYAVAWHLSLPLVFFYFWLRGRKEPVYRQFWGERLGRVTARLHRPVWLHAASLGELRGVIPLIDQLLAAQLPVLITTLTPAGRSAACSHYEAALLQNRLQVVFLPLELPWSVARFVAAVQPRCFLSSEIDTWPVLLRCLKARQMPTAFVNAGYPEKSFLKDGKGRGFRAVFFRAYDLVLCKSSLHAKRFEAAGCPQVRVTGELRFDLPLPQAQLDAARRVLHMMSADLASPRPVFCLASMVEGEEADLIAALLAGHQELKNESALRPLWICVPRSPQRFDAVFKSLQATGLNVVRRSEVWSGDWQAQAEGAIAQADVLLGDSLGEMFFYLALADHVTVGGSFSAKGSHNIIEPLALSKPVAVGPSIWTIEYPVQEALQAGVVMQVGSASELPAVWQAHVRAAAPEHLQRAQQFLAQHSGSVAQHWQHLQAWLPKV